MRLAGILALAVTIASCGCAREVQKPENLQPYVAAFGHYGVLEAAAGPTPAPAPSGECTNCNGKGSVSDGRVSVKCPVCDGRGTLSGKCSTGACQWPTRSILP